MRCSVYREEAVDAIIEALDCGKCNHKIQEQFARALMMLGGRFSYTGEATTENWLLQQAGFNVYLGDSCQRKEVVVFDDTLVKLVIKKKVVVDTLVLNPLLQKSV